MNYRSLASAASPAGSAARVSDPAAPGFSWHAEKSVLLSREEEISLGRAWIVGKDRAARDRLITSNIGLVISLARRLAGRGVPTEELIAEGQLGLITAVDRFNPDSGCRLSTYAVFWIRQSLSQAFVKGTARGSLNRADRLALRTLEAAERSFALSRGRAASYGELGDALGWSAERVRAISGLKALHTPQGYSGADSALDSLANTETETTDHTDDDGDRTETDELSDSALTAAQRLPALVAKLPAQEQHAVSLRFGLDGAGSRTLEHTAAIMGTTTVHVRAALARAIKQLSRAARAGEIMATAEPR